MRELRWLSYFSLIYGGFLVMTYLAFAYFAIWHNEILPIFPGNRNERLNASLSVPPQFENASVRPFFRDRQPESAVSQVFSPPALGILLTGVAFLVNGYVLMNYLRQKERKDTRNFTISTLLTDDEKLIFDLLVKKDGEATQKQVSLESGFNAVRTFRVLQRLEDKKVVKSYPYGMTKKIVLVEK